MRILSEFAMAPALASDENTIDTCPPMTSLSAGAAPL